MLSPAVKDYLHASRQRQLDELFALLRFPSVSCQSRYEQASLACAEHLAGHLKRLGFSAQLRPWRKHPIIIGRYKAPRPASTVLVYGHYDVQPPEPLEAWISPPFEPTSRDGAIYARGASDDKGQLFCHLKAMEALLAVNGSLPVNVIVLAEGEEEIGSPEFEKFITANAAELKCDHAIISDSAFFEPGLPTITYGLRGLCYFEITVIGPAADLHSGDHGGVVVNPLNALARLIAAMHDDNGRITLPGFYDDVVPLTQQERAAWSMLPFDEKRYAETLGCPTVGGEKGLPVLERRWARPTLDCNGLIGGYTGEGSKTVLPSRATAKISMRLVPNQDPDKVVDSFQRFVQGRLPAGVRSEIKLSAEGRPVVVALDSPALSAAKAALSEAFGGEVAMVRNGASVPITELIQRILKVDPVLMGLGLPDDNLHAPNERFGLGQFYGGITAAAAVLVNLGELK
jgi:acetylornithine deacetylase/succinyl-diaminopimelate desuccinylase-like protein